MAIGHFLIKNNNDVSSLLFLVCEVKGLELFPLPPPFFWESALGREMSCESERVLTPVCASEMTGELMQFYSFSFMFWWQTRVRCRQQHKILSIVVCYEEPTVILFYFVGFFFSFSFLSPLPPLPRHPSRSLQDIVNSSEKNCKKKQPPKTYLMVRCLSYCMFHCVCCARVNATGCTTLRQGPCIYSETGDLCYRFQMVYFNTATTQGQLQSAKGWMMDATEMK